MLEMHWWWKISKIYPGKCHLHTYTHIPERELCSHMMTIVVEYSIKKVLIPC